MPPNNLNIRDICSDLQEHYSACDVSVPTMIVFDAGTLIDLR